MQHLNGTDKDILKTDLVQEYKEALTRLHDEGENVLSTEKYKAATVRLLLGDNIGL